MDQETKQLLEENLRLSKENNEMLTSLIRSKKRNAIFRAVYWSAIIVVTIGSYYFIQPYIGSVMSLYSGGATDMQDLESVKANLLKQLNDSQN
jgi:hypothetical protein